MHTYYEDYIPKETDVCEVTGHNFSWLKMDHYLYKTCSKCGHFERVEHAVDKEEDAS